MMRNVSALVTILAVLTASMVAAAPQRPLYDDRYFVPVEEVVTPHISWAKPYIAPPKVLFITHRNAMREIIELSQRLSMDYTVFSMQAPDKFGETGIGVDSSWKLIRGNTAEEATERLMGMLQKDYDVIVCGGIKWDELPIAARYEILKKVKAGTGLVGSIPSGRDEYLQQLMKTSDFAWSWATWVGGTQGVDDYFGPGEFTGAVDYSGGHTGKAALRLDCKSVGKGSRESARAGYNSPEVKLEPGTEYVFSAWTKTQGLKPGGATVSLHPQIGMAIPPSEDWKYTEVKFKPLADKPTMRAYLLVYQPGTIWYDDVKLVKAGTDTNLLPNASFEFPGPAPTELAAGVPYQLLPAFSKFKDDETFLRGTFQTANFRDGRLGFVSYSSPSHQMLTPGPAEPVQYCRGDFDYYLQLATRLILWGAKKTPQVSVLLDNGAPVQAAVGAKTLPVRLQSAAATPGATVTLAVRDRNQQLGQTVKQTVNLKQGENTITFNLPPLPAGSFFANCWALNGNKVIGFGTVPLTITSPVQITDLKLGQDSFSLGQPLTGKITCEGALEGCGVHLSVRDTRGRLLTQRTIPLTGTETAFNLPMPPMITIVGWLTAALQNRAQYVDTRRIDFTVNNLYAPRDDVQFVMWQGYPNDFVGPAMAEQFSRGGIDAFYDGGSLGYGPYANQWWLPYSTRFTDSKTDWYQLKPTREAGDLVRDPCLNDPAFRDKTRDTLSKVAARGLKYSTSDFTLGDENMFVSGNWDLCFSEHCNRDFRKWALLSYSSLANLNASWGTKFETWSEVMPQTLEACKKTGNYVPWIDHRLHMDTVWAGIHDWSRGVIKETVPHARVGYEGSDTQPTTWHAADYWKLAHAMDLNNIYYRDFLSLAVRDFSTRETLLGGGWFGGYPGNRNEPFMRWFPWRTLFKGSNSFWVWAGYGHEGAVMAYDTSLYPFFQSACEEVDEIKSGPGKLLMTCDRENDGIALLWSPSSLHVGTTIPGFPDMDRALTSMVQVLHDCGLEAKVLSYAELAEGKLTNKDFKVLLLPCSQALSAAEIEQIRKFVNAGGTVVADLRPGLTDEHGKPYATPPLDDLFGVAQGAEYKNLDATLQLSGGAEIAGARLTAEHTIGDASLTLKGGTALGKLGDSPAIVSNKAGQGRTYLLNFTLRSYLSLPKTAGLEFAGWSEGAQYRQFLAGLMKTAGVAPVVTVAPDAPHVEISRFSAGGASGGLSSNREQAEYIGIVQSLPLDSIEYTNKTASAPTARPVTINFGRKAHLYDMRAGKYLGETATYKTRMTPGIAQLYALLPYRLTQVAVQTAPQVSAGDQVKYTIKFAVPQTATAHVARVEVFGPDGKERSWYARNLTTGKTPVAEGNLQLALDDQPGTWKIVAKDVATGATASTSFKVK
ncbi:MAG: beta-galactosidase [Armatimonadota bacterium]